MFGRYQSPVHIYHHYESPPCKSCGYRSNTGYFDRDSFNDHLIHIIQETNILVSRLIKDKKIKVAKK